MSKSKMPVFMRAKDWERSYEEEIPHWAENTEPLPFASELLKMLNKKSNNTILDIGIGNGRDSIFFAQKGNRVTGIDIASGAVKMARKNVAASGVTGVSIYLGNAEQLQFKNASFDAVYSISVLHATDLAKSIGEIARVLRHAGKAIIYLYEKTEEDGREYWFMKRGEIENLLRKKGLFIEDKWDFLQKGHQGEITTILVFKLIKN